MKKEIYFFLPWPPDTKTGGTLYDKQIIEGLPKVGFRVRMLTMDHELTTLPDNAIVIIDGLFLVDMHELLAAQQQRLHIIGLIHHPTSEEPNLTAAEKFRYQKIESRVYSCLSAIVVTSHFTKRCLASFPTVVNKITVAEPGVEPVELRKNFEAGDTLQLLCVATIIQRKGHRYLLQALRELRGENWRLYCVGSLEADKALSAVLLQQVIDFGLENQVFFIGEQSDEKLNELFHTSHLFVLPSLYEGYGMVLTEALARGIPIVTTNAGAIPETTPADAALCVPPADSKALATAIAQILRDKNLRKRLTSGAEKARKDLNTWASTIDIFRKLVNSFF